MGSRVDRIRLPPHTKHNWRSIKSVKSWSATHLGNRWRSHIKESLSWRRFGGSRPHRPRHHKLLGWGIWGRRTTKRPLRALWEGEHRRSTTTTTTTTTHLIIIHHIFIPIHYVRVVCFLLCQKYDTNQKTSFFFGLWERNSPFQLSHTKKRQPLL